MNPGHTPIGPTLSHRGIGMTSPQSVSQSKQIAAGHFQKLASIVSRIDLDALDRVFQRLRAARDEGAMIYVAGNGGSAATATHWANDLGKAAKRSGREPVRVICLSDNVSWLTALDNDEGYERVFAGL